MTQDHQILLPHPRDLKKVVIVAKKVQSLKGLCHETCFTSC
jgi:hypothetical protein